MSTDTIIGIRRRFLVLVGLRWIGPGFMAPLLVLVILDRGLSIAQAGMLFAIYGITTALLELPTGGLADVFGRRTVLGASAILQLAVYIALLFAPSFVWFAVGFAVAGTSRALDSGPLEAWFVDRTRVIEPNASLRRGLSQAGAVGAIALAVGAISGGLIPALTDGQIAAAIVVALGFGVVYLVAIVVLMSEPHRVGKGSVGSALRQVPMVVAEGVKLGAGNRSLRLLLGASIGVGFALAGLELLWQPRFIDLLGGDVSSTGPFGFILAGAFVLAAAGAALAPWLTRLLGGDPRRAAFAGQFLMALLILGLALAGDFAAAAVAFIASYFALGLHNPVADELLHENVASEVRTTVLSVRSMTQQIAGMIAALSLGMIANVRGIPFAWIVVAIVVGLTAFTFLRVDLPTAPDTADEPSPSEATA